MSLSRTLSCQICEINIIKAFIQQVRLQGVLVGSRSQQEDIIKTIEVHQIEPVIDKIFSLDAMVEKFEYQKSYRHYGKILLEF